jgi:hypothetical protein
MAKGHSSDSVTMRSGAETPFPRAPPLLWPHFSDVSARGSSLATTELRVCIHVNRRQRNFKPDPV